MSYGYNKDVTRYSAFSIIIIFSRKEE